MLKLARLALFPLSAIFLAIGLAPAAPALAQTSCGASGAVTTVNGSLPDGATYLLQCPGGAWNGTLFLYSHGYVAPGRLNPATDSPAPVSSKAFTV